MVLTKRFIDELTGRYPYPPPMKMVLVFEFQQVTPETTQLLLNEAMRLATFDGFAPHAYVCINQSAENVLNLIT